MRFCSTPNMNEIQGQGRTLCNVQTLQCMIGDDDVEVECDMEMHLNV